MVCTFDIIPALMQLKYEYHNLISLEDVANEPYVSMVGVGRVPIEHISKHWVSRLARAGLLGLIDMPHFGQSTEVNACMKQFLVCFHGGILWLDEPVKVMVGLISEITGLPKDGTDPSQYLCGKDNAKKLATTLKKRCDQ